MEWLKWVHGETAGTPIAEFGPGDEVRVWYRILEHGKERFGQFEGVVIRARGSGASKTFTVRRVTHGEGVERVFPVDSKTVSRIEVLRRGHVKRSRLYYLRAVIGKTRITAVETSGVGQAAAEVVPIIDRTVQAQPAIEKPEGAVAAAGKSAASAKPSA